MKKDDKNHLICESKRQPALYFISIITVALSIFVFYMIFSDWEEFALEYSSEFSAVAWTVYMLVAGNAMLVCMLWMNGRYILQIKKADENYIFRSEEHTSELQSRENLVCRLLLEKKNSINFINQKKLFKV